MFLEKHRKQTISLTTLSLLVIDCPRHGVVPCGFHQQLESRREGENIIFRLECHKCKDAGEEFSVDRKYRIQIESIPALFARKIGLTALWKKAKSWSEKHLICKIIGHNLEPKGVKSIHKICVRCYKYTDEQGRVLAL